MQYIFVQYLMRGINDENGDDERYFIIKECGNESWQPKDLFENSAVLLNNKGNEDEEHF